MTGGAALPRLRASTSAAGPSALGTLALGPSGGVPPETAGRSETGNPESGEIPGRVGAVLRPGGNAFDSGSVCFGGTESAPARPGMVGEVLGVLPCAAARLSAEIPALAPVAGAFALVGAVDAREALVAAAGALDELGPAGVPVVLAVAEADPPAEVPELAAVPAPPAPFEPEPALPAPLAPEPPPPP